MPLASQPAVHRPASCTPANPAAAVSEPMAPRSKGPRPKARLKYSGSSKASGMKPAPMNIQAMYWRRSVLTVNSMRTPRPNGTGFSSAAAKAESASSVSPRTGFFRRRATNAMARMGTIRIMKASRQPPITATMPATIGPMTPPKRTALACMPKTRGRSMGL